MKLWEHPSNYMGATWEGYYVFLDRNRDSHHLTNSNFEVAYKRLQDIGPRKRNTVKIVSEGHWLCGWVEWIAIHHSDKKAIAAAEQMERDLDNYPVLDEEDFSNREWAAATEFWDSLSVRERYEWYLKDLNITPFAARHSFNEIDNKYGTDLYEAINRD